jgi:hypothetical protein
MNVYCLRDWAKNIVSKTIHTPLSLLYLSIMVTLIIEKINHQINHNNEEFLYCFKTI